MKILTILGSPRKRGNTAAILSAFEERATEARRQAGDYPDIERINLMDYRVEGCRGCDVCQRDLTAPGCRRKDDGAQLLERILAADLVVYACPVYCWSFPAQLKALIDRHYCLVKWQNGEVAAALATGLRGALLVTCGGGAANNADLIQLEFDREMAYLGATVAGKYVVDNCTTPVALRAQAQELGARMAADLLQVGAKRSSCEF